MQQKLNNRIGTATSKETLEISNRKVIVPNKNTKKTLNKYWGLIITPPFLSMNFENLRRGYY